MINLNEYTQELLANLIESIVEMYELPDVNMSVSMGAELVQIGDRLAGLLEDFVEMNK